MAEVKVGINQINTPAPLGYRKVTNAIILCFVPMVTTIVQALPMSDAKRNVWMIVIGAIPVLLKGIGMILGNGQQYTPSNEAIENESKN